MSFSALFHFKRILFDMDKRGGGGVAAELTIGCCVQVIARLLFPVPWSLDGHWNVKALQGRVNGVHGSVAILLMCDVVFTDR